MDSGFFVAVIYKHRPYRISSAGFFIVLILTILFPADLMAKTFQRVADSEDNRKDDSLLIQVQRILNNATPLNLEDSLIRRRIYHDLDSIGLFDFSIRLVDMELNAEEQKSSWAGADLKSQKAYYLFRAGRYKEARLLFTENISLSKKEHFDDLLVMNYGGMANLFLHQTEPDSALNYCILYRQAARKLHDSLNIAESLKLSGNAYFMKAKYEIALSKHLQSLPFCDSSLLGSAYNEIGRDYFYLENTDSAEYYLEKSLSIKKEIGDIYGYCASLGNLGHLWLRSRNGEKANSYFIQCSEIAMKNGFKDLQAWMYKSRSDYEYNKSNYKIALDLFKRYFDLNEELVYLNSNIRYAGMKAMSKAANQNYLLSELVKDNEIQRLKSLRQRYIILALTLILTVTIMTIIIIKLRNQKSIAELKLKLGRTRINPHFIFNTLNLLQSNILKGSIEESNKFLSRFSSLMRSTLEGSYNDLETIDKEITHLENYLKLESMRLDNKFDYRIEIDDHLDTNYLKIPSMIIQPYVENAIWHGLLNKPSNDKKLIIRIKRSDNQVLFEIQDNGSGLKSAKDLNESENKESRISRGMDISESRLDSLSRIYRKKFAVKYSNADTGNIDFPGTIVVLSLPIIL